MTQRELFHSGLLPPAVAYGLGLLLALVVLTLLWGEFRRPGKLRYAAIATRLGMVGLLTLLLAQPNLLTTQRTQQAGHTLVLLDDSASMLAKDDLSDEAAQLRLAQAMQIPELNGRPTAWLDLREQLENCTERLAPLQRAANSAADSIRTGLPWSDRDQQTVEQQRPDLSALGDVLAKIDKQPGLSPAGSRSTRELLALLDGDPHSLLPLAGKSLDEHSWPVVARLCEQLVKQSTRLDEQLQEQQATADHEFLAAGGRRESIAQQIKLLSRYELAQQVVRAAPTLADAEKLNLVLGKQPLDTLRAIGSTQLVAPLAATLTARPLELINAVYLLSDGGQNGNFALSALDVFRKRDVKLIVVGVGTAHQDRSLTLTDYDCPTMVPSGVPFSVQVEYRADLPKDVPVEIHYQLEGSSASKKPASSRPRSAGSAERGAALQHDASITSDGSGFLHHRVLLVAGSEGQQTLVVEARTKEPALTVKHRFPIYVRAGKPAVLLVAERPDKLTENILAQEKYGIRVQPVFTFGNVKNAKRSSTKGSIPKTAKDWAAYDLVILKGRPFPGFAAEDAQALVDKTRAQGTALWLIEDNDTGYLNSFGKLLGWKSTSAGPLSGADYIEPASESAHLPPATLACEVIQNQNQWRSFSAPGSWHAVAEQEFALVRHPESQQPVMSLGFYQAGKLLCFGLGDLERMNQWQAEPFERFVRETLLDMLVPSGSWKATGSSLGIYPPVPVPGRPSLILARTLDRQATLAQVRVEGGNAGSESLDVRGEQGWLAAKFVFSDEGEYDLSCGSAKLSVRCRNQESSETRDLSLREDVLRQLAQAAGGDYFALDRFNDAVRDAPAKTRETIVSHTWRTADFAPLLLVLFLGLAAADFVLRKQLGMVL